ncbi:MAG TPA: 1-acyl-sn-glycerol-3-phosphate acyltransferase [Gemmatimonadota bacterium]|nr:1-acyl-sn-glycerol-3-phosphate acyltransferase [Gemmatimonadota bacterium]
MIASLSRFALKVALWAVDRFYEVGRVGRAIPDGPVIIIANHPNSLMDGLMVLKVAGRQVRPLGKAPLFEHPLFGHVLEGLGALPVYRPQDFPGETWRNDNTFAAAVGSLQRGEAVLIFPEGLSHSGVQLARMKTGAARIAFAAEEATNWQLGLRVVPVGLTYHRKHSFRGRVAAAVGRSFEVVSWRESRQRDEWGAVESLTSAMREALEKVTLNLPTEEDQVLIETAEALYAAEKGYTQPRSRERLAPRLPRLQRFAEALAWLYVNEPDQYARLTRSMRDYRDRLRQLGVREGELPKRFPATGVIRYALAQSLLLFIGLPLAALGTVVWFLPYKSPRLAISFYRPQFEAMATLKLASALVAFPFAFAIWLAVAWWAGGLGGMFVAAVALPLLGVVAVRWRDRWSRVREDARIFFNVIRKKTQRDELVRERKTLVQEFESVAARWQQEHSVRREREPAG